jgi:transcriptional regulator with XRE-family HTH domain
METDSLAPDLDSDAVMRISTLGLQAVANPQGNAASRALGEKVSAIRQTRGINRIDLAVASGIGDNKIQLLELGYLPDTELSFQQVEAIASALNISVQDLLADTPYAQSRADPPIAATIERGREGMGRLIGYVRERFGGGWMWQPLPASALVDVSTQGDAEEDVEPSVELDEAANQLVIEAGPRYAEGEALLQETEGPTLVGQVTLDAEGRGRLAIPDEGTVFQVELIAEHGR